MGFTRGTSADNPLPGGATALSSRLGLPNGAAIAHPVPRGATRIGPTSHAHTHGGHAENQGGGDAGEGRGQKRHGGCIHRVWGADETSPGFFHKPLFSHVSIFRKPCKQFGLDLHTRFTVK